MEILEFGENKQALKIVDYFIILFGFHRIFQGQINNINQRNNWYFALFFQQGAKELFQEIRVST